ncbi:MAG TPA: DUF5060 domain-containing protein [Chloroflexia bacterium]|nr:DUF5060 domain-containing protein [Chloroflexia bacterium]
MPEQKPSSANVEQWGIFELTLEGSAAGNPFLEVELTAEFSFEDLSVRVNGFYDGEGLYRVRFMPDTVGAWQYRTSSNQAALDGKTGSFECGPAGPGNHGPVRVANTYHFAYADGTPYKQIGTTCYAWAHQGEALEEQTLATLKNAPFNKLRMCVFPKHYHFNENEPDYYPFPLLSRGSSKWEGGFNGVKKNSGWAFDFSRFDPAFFHHFEQRLADLQALGIEADLILLHPYDRWGFSVMSPEEDDRYLRYVVARFSAYRNVWWSMANEYDLMPQKSLADWDRYFQIVQENDPYDHLRSVHNCFAFYDHSKPWVTHCSVQRSELAKTIIWREQYKKPVVVDECCYEGNIPESWGNISGREMLHRFWEGTVNGGYVGHGDTFLDPNDILWWARGGTLKGESAPRLAFLRRILEAGPASGLEPLRDTSPYRIAMMGGMDKVTIQDLFAPPPDTETPAEEGQAGERLISWFAGAGQPHEYYLTYFGYSQPAEIKVNVPGGEHYRAEIVDTWEMTVTALDEPVERGSVVALPGKPYQALILRRKR